MASTAIVLNTTYKVGNNEYTVALRVTNDRKPKYYAISTLIENQSLQFHCIKEHWKPAQLEDNGLGKFRKAHEGYKDCNAMLEQKLSDAKSILQRYDTSGIIFSFEQFEADLKRTAPVEPIELAIPSLQEYYSIQITILEEQQREGLAGIYRENKSILNKFKPGALLTDVNFRFLEGFEYWLRNVRGNMDTTISVKMRNLQRVLNQAIEDKLLKQENYPFGEKKYSINKRLDHTTKKIAIPVDKVTKLKALEVKPGSAGSVK